MIQYSDVLWFSFLTISFCGFSIFLYFFYNRWKFSKLLPSKRWLPYDVLGAVWDLPRIAISKSGFSFNVHLLEGLSGYFQLFKSEKLFCLWLSYYPLVVLVKPESVEQLFNLPKQADKAWIYTWFERVVGKGLFTNNGNQWKNHRKFLEPAFHSEILKNCMHSFNEVSKSTVEALRRDVNKEYTDVSGPLYLCIFNIVCETILGIDIKELDETYEKEFISSLHRFKEAIFPRFLNILVWYDLPFSLTKTGRQFEEDTIICKAFIKKVINDRKKQIRENKDEAKPKRKAFMDLLMEHFVNKNLSEKEVLEETSTFLASGYETTALAAIWTVYLIGLYKDVQDNIYAELNEIFGEDTERHVTVEDLGDMKYLECVIKESLRLYPAVPIIARSGREGMKICGFPMPKKAIIAVLPHQMHRDPETFPNPEIFDPDRFLPENCVNRHPYAYIPFSAGSRNCIGQRFAMMEMKVVISNILRNFSLEALDPRDKVLGTMDITLSPAIPIRMKIRPRKNV